MKYKLFSADPPWNYGNTISNGAAEDHYGTMKMEDMKRLPIWTMAEDDAVLAMWYTGTHTEEAVELAEAWGFQVRQMFLFTWVKLNMKAEERLNKQLENGEIFDAHDVMAWLNKEVKINAGNYSRQNQESMLVKVWNVKAPACGKSSFPAPENTQKSLRRRCTVWSSCMVTCHALSYSRVNLSKAGILGEINAPVIQSS